MQTEQLGEESRVGSIYNIGQTKKRGVEHDTLARHKGKACSGCFDSEWLGDQNNIRIASNVGKARIFRIRIGPSWLVSLQSPDSSCHLTTILLDY
jgi:hypothetical protein